MWKNGEAKFMLSFYIHQLPKQLLKVKKEQKL